MKLLFCKECNDVFNLNYKIKFCSCGKTSGKYLDDVSIEYCGSGQPIGIADESFQRGFTKQQIRDAKGMYVRQAMGIKGTPFSAFFIPAIASSLHKKEQHG